MRVRSLSVCGPDGRGGDGRESGQSACGGLRGVRTPLIAPTFRSEWMVDDAVLSTELRKTRSPDSAPRRCGSVNVYMFHSFAFRHSAFRAGAHPDTRSLSRVVA